jgi:hypothetical protein
MLAFYYTGCVLQGRGGLMQSSQVTMIQEYPVVFTSTCSTMLKHANVTSLPSVRLKT